MNEVLKNKCHNYFVNLGVMKFNCICYVLIRFKQMLFVHRNKKKKCCQLSWRGVLNTTLCGRVC